MEICDVRYHCDSENRPFDLHISVCYSGKDEFEKVERIVDRHSGLAKLLAPFSKIKNLMSKGAIGEIEYKNPVPILGRSLGYLSMITVKGRNLTIYTSAKRGFKILREMSKKLGAGLSEKVKIILGELDKKTNLTGRVRDLYTRLKSQLNI